MKNKPVIIFVLLLVGCWASGWFGPWWAPAAFLVLTMLLIGIEVKQAIMLGGLSLLAVNLIMAIVQYSQDKSGLLEKTGLLLGGLNPIMLIVVTSVVAFITGLLSGWLGSVLGRMVRERS